MSQLARLAGLISAFVLLYAQSAVGDATRAVDPLQELDASFKQYEQSILGRSAGLVTVEALDLPKPFLDRLTDRLVQAYYRHQVRKIVADPTVEYVPLSLDATNGPSAQIVEPRLPSELDASVWLDLKAVVPDLRGYRAPVSADIHALWPSSTVDPGDAEQRSLATFVAQRLSRDGLLLTTARVLRRMAKPTNDDGTLNTSALRTAGLPTDLLPHFRVRQGSASEALTAWWSNGADEASLTQLLENTSFDFQPSLPGFVCMAEDGSDAVGGIRLHNTAAAYPRGEMDGSVLDVIRQLLIITDGKNVVTTIPRPASVLFASQMEQWRIKYPALITVVPIDAIASQWAQDNGKSGTCPSGHEDQHDAVVLAPRYASINEAAGKMIPGDSLMPAFLNGVGGTHWVQSSLLFQGGNLMAIVLPKSGDRILLIGEAEIHRNRAMGLSREQVVDAFKMEFGVDRCVVVPAAAFHLDMVVTIRRCNEELVACMNSTVAASVIILKHGLTRLADAGLITQDERRQVTELVTDGQGEAVARRLEPILSKFRNGDRQLDERLANVFAKSEQESRSENLQRFLTAMDTLLAASYSHTTLASAPLPIETRRYLRSIQRILESEQQIYSMLEELGLRVHSVPGLSDVQFGVNYVNGLHIGTAYIMPSFGGAMGPLDLVAVKSFRHAFGNDTRVLSVRSAHVQSFRGGVHCMASLLPNVE